MASQQDFEKALARACEQARDIYNGTVERLEVHLQASGEFPYRVTVAEDQYPWVGIAPGKPAPDPDAESASSEAASGKGGLSNG